MRENEIDALTFAARMPSVSNLRIVPYGGFEKRFKPHAITLPTGCAILFGDSLSKGRPTGMTIQYISSYKAQDKKQWA